LPHFPSIHCLIWMMCSTLEERAPIESP
jgi:hypothetical protein